MSSTRSTTSSRPGRMAYPSDVSDEEWTFVAPYLVLLAEDAGQRRYALREVFNGLRYLVKTGAHWRMLPHDLPPWQMVYQQYRRWLAAGCFETLVADLRGLLRLEKGRGMQPTAAILDSRTLQSTPESGAAGRAGYDGHKRRKGSKVHAAVDTLGHLLALHVTPANAQDRAQVATLAAQIQAVTGEHVALAYVDQGYTGEHPATDAAAHGMQLEVVKLPDGAAPSTALSCCPAGGWSSAASLGRHASAAWSATTSGCPPSWPGCTSSPSPA